MLRLLKTETEYAKYYLIGIILLPISFSIFTINEILLFQNVNFIGKYFWSLIVGMGTYIFVYVIWSIRKKEVRERLIIMAPISIYKISLARWLFGISPFILVGLFIEINRYLLSVQQALVIERINGQLGMMFMFLTAIDFVTNTWFALERQNYIIRVLNAFLIILLLLATNLGVIFAVSTSLIKPFGFGGEEIFFFAWGLIISIIDAIIYTKRKSFLT